MAYAYSIYIALLVLFPPIWFLSTGEKSLIFPLTCPWIDETTVWGFVAHHTFQTVMIVYGVKIVFCFDNLINLSCLNVQMMAEIIVGHIVELQLTLVDEETSSLEIKKRIVTLITMHWKYIE